MKFKKLILYTNKLKEDLNFYSNTLGFEIIEQNPHFFTAKIGWSTLTFIKSEKERKYHYCFLIPSNQLGNALEWLKKRTEILDTEPGKKHNFLIHGMQNLFIFMMPVAIWQSVLFVMT